MNRDVALRALARDFVGELRVDPLTRSLYATDASIYQETPLAVAFPRDEADIRALIAFAREERVGLIPRTAGTSLAGQVVGNGIVVDVSRHFTRIIGIDANLQRAVVQPGVIRNELNLALKPHGLFFAPETSTASRAMIGGMFGNNSCGANSVVYGSTRDHVVSTRGFLGDGSQVEIGPMDVAALARRCRGPADSLDARIHRGMRDLLGDAHLQSLIEEHFPRPEIHRRNTGYALDALLALAPFAGTTAPEFNLCKLLAGSEGTLFFATEITVACTPLPPPEALVAVVHCRTVDEALHANLVALRHEPHASELIDRIILECTRASLEQSRNRFFLQGDPGAILVVELRRPTVVALHDAVRALETDLRGAGLGYAFPVLRGGEMERVWELRRAGLGLLSNIPGDAKPVAVVEDTAVAPEDLPAYIRAFDAMLARHGGCASVHYGHAGSGELHLRPLLNLKDPADVRRLRAIAEETASLVKSLRGSLSGEHGDGRVRAEFIRRMVGDELYDVFRQMKRLWDPDGIFNPGKIVDAPPMDASLRYVPGREHREPQTHFDFTRTHGILRAAEMCNGSGDCRKTHLTGGTMCPSYMATRDEKDTTRARANTLRQVLTARAGEPHPFDSDDLRSVLDLCLSCKGCKAECPSGVDMARMKAEFLQHEHDLRGVPWRTRLVGAFPRLMHLAAVAPRFHNAIVSGATGRLLKRAAGIHPARSLPHLPPETLRHWFSSRPATTNRDARGRVWLLVDEFTNTIDAAIGIKTVDLLERLRYRVELAPVRDSARTLISKGLLRAAREVAARNVAALAPLISAAEPLVGLEPSALLGFRDEYPDLLRGDEAEAARRVATHALLLDEFIVREFDAGRITRAQFRKVPATIHLHGHCHQKALASLVPMVRMLELPERHSVRLIRSGCCGMAGAFGYEREHYALSMAIGGLVLFPAVRAAPASDLIVAAGTSCRHQILDGTGRRALHPVEVLHASLA